MIYAIIPLLVLILTPMIMRLFFALLRTLFPAHERLAADESLEALEAKYGRWEARGVLLLFAMTPVLGVVFWYVLVSLGTARASELGRAEFYILPGGVTWVVPALFSALVTSAFLASPIVTLALGRQYAEFRRYQNLKYGISSRTLPWLYTVFAGLCMLLNLAVLDWYVVITSEEMRINPFFSARERQCRYEELVAIRTAPGFVALIGWEVEKRHYAFAFASGCGWWTRYPPGPLSVEEKAKIAAFVSERSGVPITELRVLSRDPLW